MKKLFGCIIVATFILLTLSGCAGEFRIDMTVGEFVDAVKESYSEYVNPPQLVDVDKKPNSEPNEDAQQPIIESVKVVTQFIEDVKQYDIEKMAEKVNPLKREDVYDWFSEEDGMPTFEDYLKSNASKITYIISDVKIENETATATVDFNYVDGYWVLNGVIVSLAFDVEPESSDEEIGEMVESALKGQIEMRDEKFAEKQVEIQCINIDNQWYIDGLSDDLLDVIQSNFKSLLNYYNSEEEIETPLEDADID